MRKSVWSKKGLQILALTVVLVSILVSGAFAEPPKPPPNEVELEAKCNKATAAATSGSESAVFAWRLSVKVDGESHGEPIEWKTRDIEKTLDIDYDCREGHEVTATLEREVCRVKILRWCLSKKWEKVHTSTETSKKCEPGELRQEQKDPAWSYSPDPEKEGAWKRTRKVKVIDQCYERVLKTDIEEEPYEPCEEETETTEFCTECSQDASGEWERECLVKDQWTTELCGEAESTTDGCENCTVLTLGDARWSAWFKDETAKWTRTLNKIARDKYREETVCGQEDRQEHDECEFLEEVGEEYKIKEYGDWSCWFVQEEKWKRKRQVIVKDAHYDKTCQEEEEPQEFEVDDKQLLEAAKYYWAVEVPVGEGGSRLALIAGGTHPTGYKVFLEPYWGTLDDPPKLEFALWYIAPDESANENELRIPFVVWACFEVSESQWSQQVYIYDADHEEEPQKIDVQRVIQIPVQGSP